MNDADTILKIENLKQYFPLRQGFFKRVVGYVKAVDDISFFIHKGETVGLVGESGCGKTTTGQCILKLITPTSGSIKYKKDDEFIDILKVGPQKLNEIRKDIQIIFQDPVSSLDPRMTIKNIVAEPLVVHKIGNKKEQTEMIKDLLEKVGLREHHLNRYPHEFSGGQRQRIGIARALTLNPKIIVCDEPVSALDVSIQAQVINLLSDLQQEFGLTYLFIAHDLSVVEHISDRVMVMYLGKLVEVALADEIYQRPLHPYTEALLASIPEGDPRARRTRIRLEGTVPDPSNPPEGCNLHPRCRYARDICREKEPQLKLLDESSGHFVSCHLAEELSLVGYQQLKDLKANGGA